MFIDESGDASIKNPDPRFNAFVLCGILFREDHYLLFNQQMRKLKLDFFQDENLVFHSYEMRSKKGPFVVFKDDKILSAFYINIEKLFTKNTYKVFASIIDKERYKRKYPKKDQAYEDSLKFIVERSLSIAKQSKSFKKLHICIEGRNKGKNRYLKKYYTKMHSYGTDYCSTADFQTCSPKLEFRNKNQQVNGIELADLCAYPIAWRELRNGSPHKTYDLFKDKIYSSYSGKKEGYGLKRFP